MKFFVVGAVSVTALVTVLFALTCLWGFYQVSADTIYQDAKVGPCNVTGYQLVTCDLVADNSGTCKARTSASVFGWVHRAWIVPDISNPIVTGNTATITAKELLKNGSQEEVKPTDLFGGALTLDVTDSGETSFYESDFSIDTDGWLLVPGSWTGNTPTLSVVNGWLLVNGITRSCDIAKFTTITSANAEETLYLEATFSAPVATVRGTGLYWDTQNSGPMDSQAFDVPKTVQNGAQVWSWMLPATETAKMPISPLGLRITGAGKNGFLYMRDARIRCQGESEYVQPSFASHSISVGSHIQFDGTNFLNSQGTGAKARLVMVIEP